MTINSTIADAYISKENMLYFRDNWVFSSSTLDVDEGANIFVMPPLDDEKREDVRILRDKFYNTGENFHPMNRPIFDALFPHWKDNDATVDLIVGFPSPYDSVNTKDREGKSHLVFDLILWSKYLEYPSIDENIRGVLTHELTHHLIGSIYPEVDRAMENGSYLDKLDAYAFHEGFAHLVSYNEDIKAVDWHSDKIQSVYIKASKRMQEALAEVDPERQKKLLYDAICGPYYDKYACMCSMIYLSRVWEKEGIEGLKKEMEDYHGFAKKTTGECEKK